MAFCYKCGKEIGDNVAFCGNCGTKIMVNQQTVEQPKSDKSKVEKTGLKNFFKSIFSSATIDYSSSVFKYGLIFLISIALAPPLSFCIKQFIFPEFVRTIDYLESIFTFGIILLFFFVLSFFAFAPFLKKMRRSVSSKKSSVLTVLWMIALILQFAFFFIGTNISQLIINDYLLITLIEYGIRILFAITSVLLIYKNRPQNHFVLFLIVATVWMGVEGRWFISNVNFSTALYKSTVAFAKIDGESYSTDTMLQIIKMVSSSYFGIPILIVLGFIAVRIFSKKICKYITFSVVGLITIFDIIKSISNFSFDSLFSIVENIICVVGMTLFIIGIEHKKKEICVTCEVKKGKFLTNLKLYLISLGISVVLLFGAMLTSGIISSNYINKNIDEWINFVKSHAPHSESEWDDFSSELNRYKPVVMTNGFLKNKYDYETITENAYELEKIDVCYLAFIDEKSFSDEMASKYKYIDVLDWWADDDILSVFYNRYTEMKPSEERVTARCYLNSNNNTLTVKVENDNILPISSCTVEYSFTLYYVTTSSYSSLEYGRGTKTVTVNDIDGKGTQEIEVSFNPDDYYDSYRSYITYMVYSDDVEIIGIE